MFTILAKRSVVCTKSIPMVWENLKCTAITKRLAEGGRSFKIAFAEYSSVTVASERAKYQLSLGKYSGLQTLAIN